MRSLKTVRKRFGDYICRRCLNEQYDSNLTREDCKYGFFGVCPVCNQPRNIVTDLELSGKIKMLLK